MELVLVRHGLPAREQGGHADPGLSAQGIDEARKVAMWLKEEPIAAIYTSPLRRARETAAPLVDALGLSPAIRDGLAEWDRDADAYVHIEDLQAQDDPAWHALTSNDLEAVGVDPIAFRQRVVDAFDAIVAAHRSQTVAVVCHGGVINAYTAEAAGVDRLLWFTPDYGGISRVRASSTGVRTIVSLNETGHLR